MACVRSIDDIFDLLNHATTDVNAFYQHAQLLVVDKNPVESDLYLLEITPALADKLLVSESEHIADIKSADTTDINQPTFLCTDKNTCRLLETETSNSLLLIPSLKTPHSPLDSVWTTKERNVTETTVCAIKTVYLESVSIRAPSLRNLKQLLLPSSFADHLEEQDQHSFKFYTFDQLRHRIPCSEEELLWALDRLNIFIWKGYCRLIQLDYLNRVLQAIFDLADELGRDWIHFGFPTSAEIVTNLSSLYPPQILSQILQRFFYRRKKFGGAIYPRCAKICRLVGEHLLSVTRTFALADFVSMWRAAVPRGLSPQLRRHLTSAGRAYCENSVFYHQKSITYLPSEDLPDESVEARLEALFERMPVWTENELAGYVADLVVAVPLSKIPPFQLQTGGNEGEAVVFSESENEDNSFNPADEDGEEHAKNPALDAAPAVPPALGSLLNHSCRISQSSENGRLYSEKYPRR